MRTTCFGSSSTSSHLVGYPSSDVAKLEAEGALVRHPRIGDTLDERFPVAPDASGAKSVSASDPKLPLSMSFA
jgi:hypothetical protein